MCMQPALADFRIESDRVIFLAFADGRRYRVSPGELDRFLQRDDLRRVRRALRLRQQFIQRVLPPTVVVVLLVGIFGLGRYDVYRVAHGWLAAPPTAFRAPEHTVTPATPTAPAAGSNTAVTATTSAQQSTESSQRATAPATSSLQRSARGAATPLPPATIPAKTVPPLLAPVTTPLNHAVGQLSKLLP